MSMGETWVTEDATFLDMPTDAAMSIPSTSGYAPYGTPKQMKQAAAAQKKALRQRAQAAKAYMRIYNQQAKQQAQLAKKFPGFFRQPAVAQPQQPLPLPVSPYAQPYSMPPQYYQQVQPYSQPVNMNMPFGAPAATFQDVYAATGQPSAPLWAEVPAAEYELIDEAAPVDDMLYGQGLLGLGAEAAVNTPGWANTFEAVVNKLVDTGANVYQRIDAIKQQRKDVKAQGKAPMLPPASGDFLGMSKTTWSAVGLGALALGAAWAMTRKKGKR